MSDRKLDKFLIDIGVDVDELRQVTSRLEDNLTYNRLLGPSFPLGSEGTVILSHWPVMKRIQQAMNELHTLDTELYESASQLIRSLVLHALKVIADKQELRDGSLIDQLKGIFENLARFLEHLISSPQASK